MTIKVEQPVALICIFTWLGFVCAISFMEAWLKFRAPGVTVPIGLGIGRLVFNALNKVEWIFIIATVISAIQSGKIEFSTQAFLLAILISILLLQTFWLLPQLDARAEKLITDKPILPSNLHIYFIGAEVLKVICLVVYGISLFKK
jgi:uncharacterized membrane protein (DUF485 family)